MVLTVVLLLPTAVAANWPTSGRPLPVSAWPRTTAEPFVIAVEPPRSGPVVLSAEAFAIEFGPVLQRSAALTGGLLGGGLDTPILVAVHRDLASFDATDGRPLVLEEQVLALDRSSSTLHINLPAFLGLTPTQSRYTLALGVAAVATDHLSYGHASAPLIAGIAQYVALPTQEQLARIAGLVQTADKSDTLLTWFDLHSAGANLDPELARAEAYSVVAFLISRYDVPSLRSWLSAIGTGASWNDAMRTSFMADPTTIEQDWRDNLPTWTTTGWRDNLMASFDLQPARDLLASGQYVSAKAVLDTSLNLYRQLNDPASLSDVQALVNQADTGIQAESLMTDVQAALTVHDYARANNLLDQAAIQYAQLPSEQVPTALVDAYRERATQGETALAQLDRARELARNWGRYPEARSAARAAGATFATLGDTENRAAAEEVMATLDNRQRRLFILVGTLAAAVLIWLAFWVRSRGKPALRWGYT